MKEAIKRLSLADDARLDAPVTAIGLVEAMCGWHGGGSYAELPVNAGSTLRWYENSEVHVHFWLRGFVEPKLSFPLGTAVTLRELALKVLALGVEFDGERWRSGSLAPECAKFAWYCLGR